MLNLPTFPNRSVLTPRQLEVAACVVHGMTNKETARKLSPRTVEDHRHEIHRRLGVKNPSDFLGSSTSWEVPLRFLHDDPPPVENWADQYWAQLYRWAETLMAAARMWGLP